MKSNVKATLIIFLFFIITQIIGLLVNLSYYPNYNLPLGLNQNATPSTFDISYIIFSFVFVVFLALILMKIKADLILRIWFFAVVCISITLTLSAFTPDTNNFLFFSLFIAIILGFYKIFRRNLIIHNLTELLIYPGVAAILIPLFSFYGVIIFFFLISLYDIYMVWKSELMQKMAVYQIKTLRIFSGLLVPYSLKGSTINLKKSKSGKKKGKYSVAVLGGGDIVLPIILAGVVLKTLGFANAVFVTIGASLSLLYLFYFREHGKAYPAMPYITIGSFLGLIVSYLLI